MNDVMVLIVSAGIDRDKYQLTTDLVIKELEFYKQGKIDSVLMAIAKESIINELIQIEDNPYLLSGFALRNYLHGLKYSVNDLIEIVKAVSETEIQEVAQGINLDTIFLLTGEDHDG
jgi:predicted Zn-dependent peptidase